MARTPRRVTTVLLLIKFNHDGPDMVRTRKLSAAWYVESASEQQTGLLAIYNCERLLDCQCGGRPRMVAYRWRISVLEG